MTRQFRKEMGENPVAIVVPVYKKTLSSEEETSLKHLLHFLGAYKKYLVAPRSLKINYPGFENVHFDDRYFQSPQTYSALMLSQNFYKKFTDYEYILIYQLDALVFSDQLTYWCSTGLDYIGAPWFNCPITPHITTPKVGNGGFSLRKVDSHLKVLRSEKLGQEYWIDPAAYWEALCDGKSDYFRLVNLPRKYLKRLKTFNSPKWVISAAIRRHDFIIEDEFWSNDAVKYCPEFKVASVEEGLQFSFEYEPRMCFERNNRTLPFGCHAWFVADRQFWEPFLLK